MIRSSQVSFGFIATAISLTATLSAAQSDTPVFQQNTLDIVELFQTCSNPSFSLSDLSKDLRTKGWRAPTEGEMSSVSKSEPYTTLANGGYPVTYLRLLAEGMSRLGEPSSEGLVLVRNTSTDAAKSNLDLLTATKAVFDTGSKPRTEINCKVFTTAEGDAFLTFRPWLTSNGFTILGPKQLDGVLAYRGAVFNIDGNHVWKTITGYETAQQISEEANLSSENNFYAELSVLAERKDEVTP